MVPKFWGHWAGYEVGDPLRVTHKCHVCVLGTLEVYTLGHSSGCVYEGQLSVDIG